MKSPFTGKEMKVAKEWREMTFRKELFPVVFHFYLCEETGEQFEDEHFSTLNYNQVINQYRVKHHIPFPEQIKATREKYGLSAAKMSEFMGMGANSWRNYENDEVPSKAHANLIQLISVPSNFVMHIKQFSGLDEKEQTKILPRIEKLDDYSIDFSNQLLRFESEPDITTGFKAFDRIKTEQVITYFAEQLKPFKTKLNKLLFYADFVHFSNTGQSITGLRYNAIQFGPVPCHYDILFGTLADIDVIDIEFAMTQFGEVERIMPNPQHPFDPNLLLPTELEILHQISERFKNTSAGEIAEISHQEPAWKENIEGKKIIPFHYAFWLETVSSLQSEQIEYNKPIMR